MPNIVGGADDREVAGPEPATSVHIRFLIGKVKALFSSVSVFSYAGSLASLVCLRSFFCAI